MENLKVNTDILHKGLSAKDIKDIENDLDSIADDIIKNGIGIDINDETKLRVREAIRLGLIDAKKENKVIYNSHLKNNFVPLSLNVVRKLETSESLRLYQLLQATDSANMEYSIAYLASYLIDDTKSDYNDNEIAEKFINEIIENAVNDVNKHVNDRKIEYSVFFNGQTYHSLRFSFVRVNKGD